MAGKCRRPTVGAILLIFLIVLVPFSSISINFYGLEGVGNFKNSISVGDSEIIEIDSYPNGFSDDFKLSIPEGDALDLLEFDLLPQVDISSDSHQWESFSDWSSSSAELENVDYNLTGLRINSPSPYWDFESSNHGWNLDVNGGWAWGVDSAGARSGSKAIYTYLGDYPNQMSTTYYATSPSVDCSSCSGGWNVNFWKQLGVESSTWDRAFFQVKGINGWVTIWENSGYVDDVSYSLQSYRVDSHIAGNSDFRIRFGLGPTDFSVTYDGWNIDDVSITPVSGSAIGVAKVEGSGDANWTTPEIGVGTFHSVRPGPYGLLNIIADIPNNTGLDWTIIDSNTNIPILGYYQRTEFFADLGRIDWEKHPKIKIKIHLWSDSLESPELKSMTLGNIWKFNFDQEPNASDWIGNVSLISGNFEGNGNLIFPKLFSTRPIASLNFEILVNGNGQLQIYTDENKNWTNISNIGTEEFNYFSKEIQFRWISNSGDWIFESLEIEFETGILPLSPLIDIGKDDKDEWNLSKKEIGFWGSQDRWSDGSISKSVNLYSGTPQYIDFWIPSNEIYGFCMDLTPQSGEILELDLDLRIGSNIVSDVEIINYSGVYRFCLNDSELEGLNENISNNLIIWSTNGQSYISAKIKMNGVSQRIQLSALDVTYHPIIEFRENFDSLIVKTINNYVSNSIISNGENIIPISIFSDMPSSLLINLIDQHSTSGLVNDDFILINKTRPLVSSDNWFELESKHSVSKGQIESIEYDFVSKFNEINLVYHIGGEYSIISDPNRLIELNENSFSYESNTDNISKLRFRISPLWDDDYELEIHIRLIRTDGIKSIPEKIFIGTSSLKSVENDIEIKSWSVSNDLGNIIPEGMPYLKSGSNITIDVELGFENITSSEFYPKSGDFEVYVLENGFEIGRTDRFNDGRVSFVRSIPFGPGDLNYEIKLNLNNSQQDTTKIVVNRTFTADSLAPKLISTNIERYDYRSPSQNQILSFEIFDRPVLPNSLKINLWRNWLDDFNQDGLPSIDEFWSNDMFSPSNLSSSSGEYTYFLDDSNAPIGSLVYGYITGSDSAGNLLVGGGGKELGEELFIYQVRKDSLPQILTDGINWDNSGLMWLNPGLEYDLSIPFNEKNGIHDIDNIIFNLDHNSEQDFSLNWNSTDSTCKSDTTLILITFCNVYSRTSESGPFISELEFRISFRVKWSYDPGESYVHEPSIEIIERSGYSSMVNLPQLRWRYSNEIWIDYDSIKLESEKGNRIDNNVYVLPNSSINLEGIITFLRTGENVETNLNVEVGVGFNKIVNLTLDGKFNFEIISPINSGNYPLSIDVIDDDFGIFDDGNLPQIWIVVDNQAPIIEQILSPRIDATLSRDEISDLLIEITIKETIMLQKETIHLSWSISEFGDYNYLIKEELDTLNFKEPIAGRYLLSLKIPLSDYLSSLTVEEELKFNIWVNGKDAAGNNISDIENSELNPLTSWTILPYQPMLVLNDITYSKYNDVSPNDILKVTITVKNSGNAESETNLTIIAKNSEGETIIARESIIVEINSMSTFTIDWVPNELGTQWIVVRWDGESLGEGSFISVENIEGSTFFSTNNSSTLFGAIFVFLIIILVILFIFNSDEEYYEDLEVENVNDLSSLEFKSQILNESNNLKIAEINPLSVNQKNVEIKQWTDDKGYTWRKEGNNPPRWWDGKSWNDHR